MTMQPKHIAIALTFLATTFAHAQTPNFTGAWHQDNARCQPPRNGDVTLHIEQHDPKLTVEMVIGRPPGQTDAEPKHATQAYTTDGKPSVSIGADGDEFHTTVTPSGQSLVFQVEEHEDGRILRSIETWTLIDNGTALKRVRQKSESPTPQVLIYARQTQP